MSVCKSDAARWSLSSADGVIVEEASPDKFFTEMENPRVKQFLDKVL